MKKILPAILVSLFSIALSAQTLSGFEPFHDYFFRSHGNIQKLGAARNVIYEEIAYSHDSYLAIGGTWTPSDSGVFYYNQDAADVWRIDGIYLGFVNPDWDTTAQVVDSVDVNGFVQYVTGKNYVAPNFVNSYQYSYTYNTSAPVGYLNTETLATANGGSWVDSLSYVYTNDSIGRLTKVVVQTGATLQNDSQYLYYYNGWYVTNVVTQVWVSSAWINVSNTYNNYDANGNVTQSTGYTWTGTNWAVNNQTISSYSDNNELQTYYYYLWDASANGGLGGYVNSYYETYQYVLSNNTQFENFNWDTAGGGAWVPDLLLTYSYDGNHNIILEQDQLFAADTFGNTDLYYFYYNSYQVSGVNDLRNDLGISIYPNPSSGNAVVSLTTGVAGNISINIYDEVGKLLKRQQTAISQGANQIQLNLTGLAAGDYYVQVSDYSGKTSVLQFIKQ